MDDKTRKANMEIPHNIILESREKMSITGVVDVESFDENTIIIKTTKGNLTVRGEGLHIEKLNLENYELTMEGEIYLLEYDDNEKGSAGFFSRLFG